MVDDFLCSVFLGGRYRQFLKELKAKYPIKVNIEAKFYIGINLYWDYVNSNVILYAKLCVQGLEQI